MTGTIPGWLPLAACCPRDVKPLLEATEMHGCRRALRPLEKVQGTPSSG